MLFLIGFAVLALPGFDEKDIDFLRRDVEDSSKGTYESRLSAFDAFVTKESLTDLAVEVQAVKYIRHCSELGRAASSISGFVSALNWRYRLSDKAIDPSRHHLVHTAVKAGKKAAPTPTPKAPFLHKHLEALHDLARKALFEGKATLARKRKTVFAFLFALLAQRGLLRGDEVACLLLEETWLEQYALPSRPFVMVEALLLYLSSRKATPKKAKMKAALERKGKAAQPKETPEKELDWPQEQLRRAQQREQWKAEAGSRLGAIVAMGADPDKRFCPITWLRLALALRDPKAVHLVHQLDKAEKVSSGTLRNWVQSLLTEAGFEGKKFGAHSPRRGGATAALKNKLPTALIMKLGAWKSDSVFLYMDPSVEEILTASEATLISRTA